MPFIGILSSFSRKGENVRNFAFLRGIFGFCAPFRFFRSKMEKIAKVRFERKVPLRTSHETYIYIRFLSWQQRKSTFSHFSDFFIFGATWVEKVLRSAKKRKNPLFCSKKWKNAFFAFWTGKHLPEPYVYKAFYALAKTVIFCVSRIFYILLEIFFTFAEKVLRVAEVFCAEKSLPKNVHLGFVFKGAHYFPAPKTDLEHFLRKVRNISEICVLGVKSVIFSKKSTFSVPGIPFPARSLKTLRNQCFFRCFGVHFPPFRTFSLNFTFFAPKPFLARKITFLRKSA